MSATTHTSSWTTLPEMRLGQASLPVHKRAPSDWAWNSADQSTAPIASKSLRSLRQHPLVQRAGRKSWNYSLSPSPTTAASVGRHWQAIQVGRSGRCEEKERSRTKGCPGWCSIRETCWCRLAHGPSWDKVCSACKPGEPQAWRCLSATRNSNFPHPQTQESLSATSSRRP
jgi:hypothetical protein